MSYRLAEMTESDRTAVVDVFNYFIENSFAAYPEAKVGYEIFDRFRAITGPFTALTVRDATDKVIGFALLHPFHPADSFRGTAEVSYFLLPEHTRKGLGTLILERLIADAKLHHVTTLLASISSLNDRSINFHLKHGFRECGRFRGVGNKNGKAFDMIWMQKELTTAR